MLRRPTIPVLDARYRPLLTACYPAALVIALVPFIRPLLLQSPVAPGEAAWRFGLLTALVDGAPLLLAGTVLALLAALLLDDRAVLKGLGWTSLALGAVILVLIGILVAHGIALRARLDPALRDVSLGVGWRVFGGGLTSAALLTIGLAARRALSGYVGRSPGQRRTSDRIDPGSLR